MRVYTEVIFEWDEKQGKLVEISSNSFDYSGEVALCGWKTEELGYDQFGNKYTWKGNKGLRNWKNTELYVSRRNSDGSYSARELIYDDADSVSTKTLSMNRARNYISQYEDGSHTFHGLEAPTDLAIGESLAEEGGYEVTQGDIPAIKATAVDALKGFTSEWGRITSGDSEYHRAVGSSLDALTRAGEGVKDEFYIDPITNEKVTVAGALTVAREDYLTGVERSEEDLVASETVANIAREGGLEAARAGIEPAIRQAEARTAATGFAATGAGDEAREDLAEAFISEVEGVETGFDVQMDAAQVAQERAVEDLTGVLGGAEASFAGLTQQHEDTVVSQEKAAQAALRQLQVDMSSVIADARTTLDDRGWNPFDDPQSVGITGTGDIYGWEDPGFNPATADTFSLSGSPTEDLDLSGMTGLGSLNLNLLGNWNPFGNKET